NNTTYVLLVTMAPPPPYTIFPYTTLFRSRRQHQERPVRHQLRRRAGGHHLGQVRFLGQRGLLGGKRQGPIPREGRDHHRQWPGVDRKSTRLKSSHVKISYAVFCQKKNTIS